MGTGGQAAGTWSWQLIPSRSAWVALLLCFPIFIQGSLPLPFYQIEIRCLRKNGNFYVWRWLLQILIDTALRQVGRPCVFGGSVVMLTVFTIIVLALTVGIQQDCFNTSLVNYDHWVAHRFHPAVVKRSPGYASRATYRNVLYTGQRAISVVILRSIDVISRY